MLRICGEHLLADLHYSRRRSVGFGRILVAHLRSRHCPPSQSSGKPPLKGLRSSEAQRPTSTTRHHSVPLTRKVGDSELLRPQIKAQRSRQAWATLFARLLRLLAKVDVSGFQLWHFVRKYFTTPHARSDYRFNGPQKVLLSRVLRRILDEWARDGNYSEGINLHTVIQFYVRRNLFSRKDWVYYLGFLARTAYLNAKLRRDQHAEHGLANRNNDAIRLRILCKAWKWFLLRYSPRSCRSTTPVKVHGYLWPRLRQKLDSSHDDENGTDYVKSFTSLIARETGSTDPDLDRHLSYNSILTLVALYSNMMTFAVDNVDALSATGTHSRSQVPTLEGKSSSILQPNWHLGPGQGIYWAPEIGHLSSNEASMLHLIAHAAREATLNLTLLRIVLAQMSLPESDAQEIARIYQGFKLAIPAIMAKFQAYAYDESVYQRGLLRRYPFKAFVKKAMVSKHIGGLEHAGAVAADCRGIAKTTPSDLLALVEAFLQLDEPVKALRYWNVLAQRGNPNVDGWRFWLDYAFQKKDYVAYDIVWNKLCTLAVPRSAKMWYQRLLLLHETHQPSAAWSHFCTLIRYSGLNKKLVGHHVPLIAPSTIDSKLFHMMIKAYLRGEDGDQAKAKEVLQLMKKQVGLQVTRRTYMLFVKDSLRTGARDSAIEWFVEGKSLQIKFLPGDYALLFEHSLNKHGGAQMSPLANFRSPVLRCFEAISAVMRLARGGRLFTLRGYQVESSSSKIESALKAIRTEKDVDDDLKDPILKETQSLYAALMRYLAQKFAKQPPSASKTARLRLLLLLWDHCIITGISASTEMESILRFVIHSMHPDLQEKLMTGVMFQNYDPEDTVSFYSYRSLRLIGRQWFAERISLIAPACSRSQLGRLPWNGYDAVTEETLIDVGMSSQEDRRKILNQIKSWKNSAIQKRANFATKIRRKEERKFLRYLQSNGVAENFDDPVSEAKLEFQEQPDQIEFRKETISNLQRGCPNSHDNKAINRRAVFKVLCDISASAE
ncbi:hypothetical protein GJ744_006498 [Endocarpon pusillum]|uniref:Uncharacterized protein n=1 Tax=Endocarpon pusillum TaxID=364733 RepID=A0A8H7AT46_9EURO|nr:hypothetical protein GJ744_006498 [Endocarpon pusillum]